MTLHVSAGPVTGAGAGVRQSAGIKSAEIRVSKLFIPRIAFQIFVTVGDFPEAAFAGFAQGKACLPTLLAVAGSQVIHVFAAESDGEGTFINHGQLFQTIGNGGVDDYG